MKLTAENVETVFMDCLFKDDEDKTGYVEAHGITVNVGFHPERLKAHAGDVKDMLLQLPDSFQSGKGGGMSFLNACMDKDGVQWGEHRSMEQLFLLGEALGMSKCLMPREMWQVLPGGMPYYAVTTS